MSYNNFVITVDQLPAAAFSKLAKLVDKYHRSMQYGVEGEDGEVETKDPTSEEITIQVAQDLYGVYEGCPSVAYHPISELVELEEIAVQRNLLTTKVVDVLYNSMGIGLLDGQPLLRPIQLGYYEVEVPGSEEYQTSYILEGGRHRTAAIILLLNMLRVPESEILEFELPCIELPSMPERIVADNKSRNTTRTEVAGLRVSVALELDDLSNDDVIWKYLDDGQLPGTAASQLNTAARLSFINQTRGKYDLTEDTLGNIGASLVTRYNKLFPKEQRYAIKNTAFVRRLVTFGAKNLKAALDQAQKQGVTNIARSTVTIADIILGQVQANVQSGKIKLPKPPVKGKVQKTTSARKSRKVVDEAEVVEV